MEQSVLAAGLPLFAVLLLSIGIPVLYIVIASVVGIVGKDSRIFENLDEIDRSMVTILSAILWPAFVIYYCVWVVLKGRASKKTRIGRAQRKAQKLAARIADLEREVGLRP